MRQILTPESVTYYIVNITVWRSMPSALHRSKNAAHVSFTWGKIACTINLVRYAEQVEWRHAAKNQFTMTYTEDSYKKS